MMLHKETVSKETWGLLQKLMADEALKEFVLVGGTALSLKLGHRVSVDIDLFSENDFNAPALLQHLNQHYESERGINLKNAVFIYLNKIKVDLIAHQYPMIKPVENLAGIRLASNEDIGAMKLHAIVQSGTRLKDFIDMYFLLERAPLNTFAKAYAQKYPNANARMACMGLQYHNNINFGTTVELLNNKGLTWKKISDRLKNAVVYPNQQFEAKNSNNDGISKDRSDGYRSGRRR